MLRVSTFCEGQQRRSDLSHFAIYLVWGKIYYCKGITDILQLIPGEGFARKTGKSHKDFVDGIKSVIGWIYNNFWPPGQIAGSI